MSSPPDDNIDQNYPETLPSPTNETVIKKEKTDHDELEHSYLERMRNRLGTSSPNGKRPRSEDSGVCVSPTSLARMTEANGVNSPNKRLRPDPMTVLCKSFPTHNRDVLQTIYRGCGGNVVQSIEFILENQSTCPPLPMITVPRPPNFLSDTRRDGLLSAFRPPEIVTTETDPRRPELPRTTFYLTPRNGDRIVPNVQLASRVYPVDPSPLPITRTRADTASPSDEEETEDHKFCTNCGRKVQLADNFCGSCGHRITRT